MNCDRVHCGHGELAQTRNPHSTGARRSDPCPAYRGRDPERRTKLARVEAPEGWVKKVERAREGKVWVGYFHVWETAPDGQRVRRKKEKTLGPAEAEARGTQ